MVHCINCEEGFMLKSLSNGSVICSRAYLSTDPNYNISNQYSSSCESGYYIEPNTNSCVSCSLEYCDVCDTVLTCSKCIVGYYVNVQLVNSYAGTNVTLCVPCGTGCRICKNAASCTQCNPGYWLQGTVCIQCEDPNCAACMVNGQCQSNGCYSYAFYNTTTLSCQLCSSINPGWASCYSINSTTIQGSQCAYGYTMMGIGGNNNCLKCTDPYCQACYLQSSCMFCYPGAYNNQNFQCQPCSDGCLNCTSQYKCSICQSTFYLQSFQNKSEKCIPCQFPCVQCYLDVYVSAQPVCEECVPGFYLSIQKNASTLCLYCNITNCATCTSSTFCTKCQDGYYPFLSPADFSQSCQQCPQFCIKCIANNLTKIQPFLCLQCEAGYYTSGVGCIPCEVQNCIFCSADSTKSCEQCAVGFMLFANNSYNQPQPPYICMPCSIKNCEVCNETYQYNIYTGGYALLNPFCFDCIDGYYLQNNSTCSPCSSNCISCSNLSNCLTCQQGFYPVFNQSTSSQTCQSCPQSCLFCTSQGCLTCASGYYHQTTSSISSNQIYQCFSCSIMPGCLSCSYQNWCQICNTNGYAMYPDTYGLCLPCGDSCTACDQDLTCTACEEGYQLMTQLNQCMLVSGWPIWAIFTLSTLGFMTVFVILEKIIRSIFQCIHQKKVKNHNQKISGDETQRSHASLEKNQSNEYKENNHLQKQVQ